ncbi:MAG: hypothetical protein HZA83_02030, partial [Thaumarchaeota archaeon]|nr:hypothetical protein [Nitrososphaerota archaeon]
MPNKENVVLLEFKDEAEAFLDYCKKQDVSINDFRIIALQPSVQVFFKKLGIEYENTLRYLPNESHARILLQCEKWVRFLEGRIRLDDGSGIKGTYNNTFMFYVRFYLFYFLEIMEIAENILRLHKVNALYVVGHKNNFVSAALPLMQDNEWFLAGIIKKLAEREGVAFVEINAQEKTTAGRKQPLLNTLPFRQALSKFFKALWSAHISHRPVILLTTTGYNIGRLVQQLKRDFPGVAFVELCNKKLVWCTSLFFTENLSHLARVYRIGRPLDARIPVEEQPLNASNSRSWRTLAASIDAVMERMKGEWHGQFERNGVNFVDVFFEKMNLHMRLLLLRLHNESKTMQQVMDQLDIKLLISPFARERSLMIAELCKNKGIRTLMVSHGTVIKPANELERIEYRHMGQSLSLAEFYDYAAIQTPVQERHFLSYETKNIPIRTGNLILAKTDA